jgi:hypothetical protein
MMFFATLHFLVIGRKRLKLLQRSRNVVTVAVYIYTTNRQFVNGVYCIHDENCPLIMI